MDEVTSICQIPILVVPSEARVVDLQGGSAAVPPPATASKGKSSGIVIGIGVAVALAVLGEPYFARS